MMGIYGLTSYIANHASDCFVDYKLHNCVVLIDGNSAAALIYSTLTKSNHAFGGDYDRYAHSTSEFLKLLIRCNVRPIFVFDGGYESRKVKTIIERIKMNVIICGQYKHKYRESRTFPLLLRDVFKMILHELNMPVIQCDFEADHEIVTLARVMKYAVISSDSDFYLSNVRYIPFTTIQFRTVRFKKKTGKRCYYLSCKVFDEDKFLTQFGGLENKSLLPLLSCALGNDYIPTNAFKHFLNMDHMTKFDDRIRKILKWLRTVTSVDNAIDVMTGTLIKNRNSFRKSIKQLTSEFNRTYSILLPYLPAELTRNTTLEDDLSKLTIGDMEPVVETEDSTLPTLDESIEVHHTTSDLIDLSFVRFSDRMDDTVYCNGNDDDIIELDEEEYEISYSDSEPESNQCDISSMNNVEKNRNTRSHFVDFRSLSDTPTNNYSEIHVDLEIPAWLSEKFRLGLISPTVMNVFNFQRIFILSQSEDYFCRPSHEVCLPVLQLAVGIILGETTEVHCHARSKNMQIGVYNIIPILEIPSYGLIPNLRIVSTLNAEMRTRVILEGLDIPKCVNLGRFPKEWRLYVITLVYWKKNCVQCVVNSNHIRTLFVCLIYLSIIDKKIGFARCNNDLKNLHKTFKKLSNDCDSSKEAKPVVHESEESKDMKFSFQGKTHSHEYLQQVSENDCFRAANNLLHYHRIDENLLKNRTQFNQKIVHAFAQLQHCMHSIMLLNSILDFPFEQYKPHLVFSGTFVYNFYSELHNRKLADGYITRTLLAKSNSLIAVYRYLIDSWEVCISLKEAHTKVKKKKSKRKRNAVRGSSAIVKVCDVDADESYKDPDNIFSMLPEE